MSLLDDYPLPHINSATKYPSIATYHVLKNGKLTSDRSCVFVDDAIITEKLDGSNGRIIFAAHSGDYMIGSREELLYARGDRVPNPAHRIVEAMRPLAERMVDARARLGERCEDVVLVLWGEVYGGKQYSNADAIALRVFDAARFTGDAFREVCSMERPRIASWRDAGNQPFRTEDELHRLAGIHRFEVTPRLPSPGPLPVTISETHAWLKRALPAGSTVCNGGSGEAEGVVVRSADRKRMAKIRFEDYEKAARKP